MQVAVERASVTALRTPMVVLGLLEGVTAPTGALGAVDQALGGLVSRLIASGEVRGELGRASVIHNQNPGGQLGAERVLVVGLGPREELDLEAVRVASGTAARQALDLRLDSFATVVHGAGAGGLDPAEAARALVEAAQLALYRYTEFKSSPQPGNVERMVIVEQDAERAAALEPVVRGATVTAEAVNRTRELSDGPPNLVTPTYLGEQAQALADRYGLECRVYGKQDLERMGMNAILAVNAGSARPPVLVDIRYKGPNARKTLAYVGKGITFDSGGISIKPAEMMHYMRHDMSGAAAVLGFIQVAAEKRLPLNVIGIFAATENMPSGSAYKPGDIIKTYSGKTVEITNTDAEGRVILSDALAYAAEQNPDLIIDIATLTGACSIALGDYATGMMTNDDRVAALLEQAGVASGELVWRMPLWKVYFKQMDSTLADMKNAAHGRRGGMLTAAQFLLQFVGGKPWVHLDIAPTAYTDEQQKYIPPYQPRYGATGVGVRLLEQFAERWMRE